jgi:hypothetical protein
LDGVAQQNAWFEQLFCCGFESSGMWRCIAGLVLPDVSKERSARGVLNCDTGQRTLRLIKTIVIIIATVFITLRTVMSLYIMATVFITLRTVIMSLYITPSYDIVVACRIMGTWPVHNTVVRDVTSRFVWLPVAMFISTPLDTIKFRLVSVVTVLQWSSA